MLNSTFSFFFAVEHTIYLYEHPEELTEVQIVRKECQRCTAVVWKHSASESRHQEADL